MQRSLPTEYRVDALCPERCRAQAPAGPDANYPGNVPQQEVELILMRHLAAYLAMPIFLVGVDGRLLFYNEPAESLLGRPFDASRDMPKEEWLAAFAPSDHHGTRLPPEQIPLLVALEQRRPVHRALTIRGLDGQWRPIEATCFPLEGLGGRHLGAVAIFWGADAR